MIFPPSSSSCCRVTPISTNLNVHIRCRNLWFFPSLREFSNWPSCLRSVLVGYSSYLTVHSSSFPVHFTLSYPFCDIQNHFAISKTITFTCDVCLSFSVKYSTLFSVISSIPLSVLQILFLRHLHSSQLRRSLSDVCMCYKSVS